MNFHTQQTYECNVQTDFAGELLNDPPTGEIMNLLNNANFEVMKRYKGV